MAIAATLPRQGLKDSVYESFAFGIEIEGLVPALFNEVSSLDVKMEVEEYKEGGRNGNTLKFPGRVSFSTVTLKWGTQYSSALWDWYDAFVKAPEKKSKLKTVHIVQLDGARREAHRWTLLNAFPVKWSGPAFKASGNEVGIEALEIAFSDVKFDKV